MPPQDTSTHTKNRVIRVPDEDWDDFGKAVGERNRAAEIRAFIAWRIGRPGAKRPTRPSEARSSTPGSRT